MRCPKLPKVHEALGRLNLTNRKDYLTINAYIKNLEGLVEQASCEDFYGTEGWQHALGIDE